MDQASTAITTFALLVQAIKDFQAAEKKAARRKAHIIARARVLKATHRLPKEWNVARGSSTPDKAFLDHGLVTCPEDNCERAFLDELLLQEHADAVHTFDDIERLVSESVRENYSERGDYDASPPRGATWAWIRDLATDWVVFIVEKDTDSTLFKAAYSITDGVVTLGDPVEVVRKTVYEPVKKETV